MRACQRDQLLAEHAERAAGAERPARAAGGVPDEIHARRSGMEADVLLVDAERPGHDLGKCGLVPLPGGLRDREQRHGAVPVEFHRDLVLGHGAPAARFEIGRDADAAQLSGAPGRRPAPREARPVGVLERVVHHALEIAAVVSARVGCLVGHRRARDEVPPPQLDRVEAVLARGVIHQPLDGVGDVGTPGAAVRGHRRRVGVREARAGVQGGNAVHAAHRDREVAGGDEGAEGRAVGAEVGAVVEADREEVPVRVERDFAGERDRAPLEVAQEGFAARADPFHGAAELFRRQHRREVLRVGRAVDAEAAADVLGGDDDPVLVEAGDGRDLAAHAARALDRRVDRVAPAFRVERHQARARLQHVADQALAVHGEPAHESRARERGRRRLRVAGFVLEREVARNVGVELRRAVRHRGIEARDGGQVPVFDLDQFPRVLGARRGVRDDHRDRLADEAHAFHREHGVVGLAQRLAVLSRVADHVGKRLEPRRARVRAGEHRFHAGMGQRPGGVEPDDLGVRAVGPQHGRVQLARQVPVGGVAAVAGDEAGVFSADHRQCVPGCRKA